MDNKSTVKYCAQRMNTHRNNVDKAAVFQNNFGNRDMLSFSWRLLLRVKTIYKPQLYIYFREIKILPEKSGLT